MRSRMTKERAASPPQLVTEQSGREEARTFIYQQRRVDSRTQAASRALRGSLGPFLEAPVEVREGDPPHGLPPQTWVLPPLLSLGRLRGGTRGMGQASHVGAELEKEEEEGHHQRSHQDVMEEPRAGTCRTRKVRGSSPSAPRREAPVPDWGIPDLTKTTGLSPINWAMARMLAWSESG